jgi:hypothetical protein
MSASFNISFIFAPLVAMQFLEINFDSLNLKVPYVNVDGIHK